MVDRHQKNSWQDLHNILKNKDKYVKRKFLFTKPHIFFNNSYLWQIYNHSVTISKINVCHLAVRFSDFNKIIYQKIEADSATGRFTINSIFSASAAGTTGFFTSNIYNYNKSLRDVIYIPYKIAITGVDNPLLAMIRSL